MNPSQILTLALRMVNEWIEVRGRYVFRIMACRHTSSIVVLLVEFDICHTCGMLKNKGIIGFHVSLFFRLI
jgi:hypothetical protein